MREIVEIRPIFYLNGWLAKDFPALKRIAATGWPVLLKAEDIQCSPEAGRLLQIFSDQQLQILSTEVEDHKNSLQLVIENCLKNGWTHLITINQYSFNMTEILSNLEKDILENPWQFLCFVPKEKSENKNHPIVKRLLDLGEVDYRSFKSKMCVYPVFYIQDLKFKKNDPLEHLKILVHAFANKRKVRKRAVNYKLREQPTRLWHRTRSFFYDWWLLALTSLHHSQRPFHSAVSLAMGVFLACTPFYGLQTLLIIGASLLFRLSFPIAFLGSQVSLPPIYSIIVPLQLYVGFKITGESSANDGPFIEVAQSHFSSWAIGSVIVGGVLAVLLGCIWYLVQKKSQKKASNWTDGI